MQKLVKRSRLSRFYFRVLIRGRAVGSVWRVFCYQQNEINLLQFFDRKGTLFRGLVCVWVNDDDLGDELLAAQFTCVNETPCIETREERLMTF